LDKLNLALPKNGGTSDMGDSGISSDPTSMTSPGDVVIKNTINNNIVLKISGECLLLRPLILVGKV
jgi:hypothetical protein